MNCSRRRSHWILSLLLLVCPALFAGGPQVTRFDGSAVELPARAEIAPMPADLVEQRFGIDAGDDASEAGVVILVRSTGEEGVAPTDTDNDYTRIVDGLAAAATLGDGTTIELLGTFDWTEMHAFDDWEAGGYGPLVPSGLADITLTAGSLGDAVILGRGDVPGIYYEGFLYFFGGTYQGWTVSNLDLRGFDWTLGFFFDTGGSSEDFNGLSVLNNRIEMPIDQNASVDAGEAFQNIGIHFAFGEDQLFMDNEILIPGNSESDTLSGDTAASVGMQSNTSGGDAYDGLMLVDNTIRVLNAPTIDPGNNIGAPFIAGFWENSACNAADITVSGNQFINEDPANDPADNLQRAFRLHAQASAASGKTVTYWNNMVVGAHWGLTWLEYSGPINYDDTSVPVLITGNQLVDTATAIRVRSDDGDARGTLRHNRVSGTAVGLEVDGGDADAEDNWWGCNGGLDATGCAASLLTLGTMDGDPWLVLTADASPLVADITGSSSPTGSVRWNSDGTDLGAIPFPASDVGFATSLGMVSSPETTVDGTATALLTSTETGLARVTATLDAGMAETTVLFTDGGVVPVQSTGETGDTPTAFDNDYTRINDIVQAVGEDVTVELEGTFDWTEPFAAAAWEDGSDGMAATFDDFSLHGPPGFDNVSIRASALGDAIIQGPGDLPGQSFELFLYLDGGTFEDWTVENLDIRGFDWSIGMFCCTGPGGSDQFDGVSILGNRIEVPVDWSPHVAPDDNFQNAAIHFAFGSDQTISGNEILIAGTGVSDTSDPDPMNHSYAASVGMQSNTSGGSVYDGLMISDNTIRITGAQSADPERIYGIWENAHGHTSNVTVSGNAFLNEDVGNDAALNRQRAFRVTSHSSATTAVLYSENEVVGANIGIHWLGDNYTFEPPATVEAVEVVSNTLVDNGTGIWVHSDNGNTNARANLAFNRIVGNGVGVRSDDSHVNAENNWWGCNEGPDTIDCDATVANWTAGGGAPADLLDADPWLVAMLSVDPLEVFDGRPTTVTVDLTHNSDAADTSGLGTLPDGIPVALSAGVAGTFNDGMPTTVDGVATDVFTADVAATPGPYTMDATVDNEDLSTALWIADVIFADGFESGDTTAW